MRKPISLVWIIFTALACLVVVFLLVTELKSLELAVINSMPEEEEPIKNINKLFLLITTGVIIALLTFIITIISIVRRPNPIVHEQKTNKDEKPEIEQEEKAEEEKVQNEEQISLRVRQIDELITGETLKEIGDSFLISLSKQFDIVQAILYTKTTNNEFKLTSTYAYYSEENSVRTFKYGHGLPGQVAMNKTFLNLNNIPKKYLTIMSGLGKGSPKHLFLFPVLLNGESFAVVELASFSYFDTQGEEIIRRIANKFAQKVNLINTVNLKKAKE